MKIRLLIVIGILVFVFGVFAEESSANPVYNFTFHNYSTGQSTQDQVTPNQPQTQTITPSGTTPNIVTTVAPPVVKEENFNPWRLYFGQQRQDFKAIANVSTIRGNYSKSRFNQTHYIMGINVPLTERMNLKPMYLIGNHKFNGENFTEGGGDGSQSLGQGKSQGLGTDLEFNIFKSRFDLRLGASYRYFKNERGALKYLTYNPGENKVTQNIQTIAAYISPTFTYQFFNLSINAGIGSIINEKISSSDSSLLQENILKKPFIQYGATVAFNF